MRSILRNTMFTAILATALLSFQGCSKSEGQYSAKEKITAVYRQSAGWYTSYNETTGNLERIEYNDPRYECEEWLWEKGKLTAITLKNADGSSDGRETYSYSGGNLTVRENRSAGVRTTYSYVGDKLCAIECYIDGQKYSSSQITHEGDKIVTIATTVYRLGEYRGKFRRDEHLTLAPWLNSELQKHGTTNIRKSDNSIYSETLTLHWDGDNISKVESHTGSQLNCYWLYTYDTGDNPLYNFWTKQDLTMAALPRFGSRNNLVSARMVASDGEKESLSFQYQYNGKYPIRETRIISSQPDAQYPSEETVTTEYIYK